MHPRYAKPLRNRGVEPEIKPPMHAENRGFLTGANKENGGSDPPLCSIRWGRGQDWHPFVGNLVGNLVDSG